MTCGGISSPSTSRRRGRKATGRSCTCRWGAPASNFGTIGSASTVHAALDVQQGVTLAVVLPQERRRCPSVGVHRAPDRRGLGAVEEVGHPGEGQEEDPRPYRRHPHPKGKQPERVRHHRGLPCEEGGTLDDVWAPAIYDGARGVVRWNGAHLGNAPQLQDRATYQGGDGAFVG